MEPSYKVVRHYFDAGRSNTVVKKGLSLNEARRHCKRPDAHGDGWFDSYTRDGERLVERVRELRHQGLRNLKPGWGTREEPSSTRTTAHPSPLPAAGEHAARRRA
jgi:hypothetical protein